MKSTKKWLRAHRNFEWPDAYNPVNLAELERFFARYLKLERNGWELTPKVRIEVQDVYDLNYMETAGGQLPAETNPVSEALPERCRRLHAAGAL